VVINDLLKAEGTAIPFDYKTFKNEQYDKLAAHLREHLDLTYIYSQLK
jgi:adenosylcobyric acid synthase